MCLPWSLDGQSLGLTRGGSCSKDAGFRMYSHTHCRHDDLDVCSRRRTRVHATRRRAILVTRDGSSSDLSRSRVLPQDHHLPRILFILARRVSPHGPLTVSSRSLVTTDHRRHGTPGRTAKEDEDEKDDVDDDDGVSWRWSIARRSTDVATLRHVVARGSCTPSPLADPHDDPRRPQLTPEQPGN